MTLSRLKSLLTLWEQNKSPGVCDLRWGRRTEGLKGQELQGFSHLCEHSLCSQKKKKKFFKESEENQKEKVSERGLGEKEKRFARK